MITCVTLTFVCLVTLLSQSSALPPDFFRAGKIKGHRSLPVKTRSAPDSFVTDDVREEDGGHEIREEDGGHEVREQHGGDDVREQHGGDVENKHSDVIVHLCQQCSRIRSVMLRSAERGGEDLGEKCSRGDVRARKSCTMFISDMLNV